MSSGWQTVLHYGSLIGQYSLLTLLPELRLGIFTSYNGAAQPDPFTVSSLLHVHLVDLFIGGVDRPSVDNATYWCRLLAGLQSRRRNVDVDTAAASLRYPVDAYVGVYWHDVLGEFEVEQFATIASLLPELTCHMGSYSVTCHTAEVRPTFPPFTPANL